MDQESVSVENESPPAIGTTIPTVQPMAEAESLSKEGDTISQEPAGNLAIQQPEAENVKEAAKREANSSEIPDSVAPVAEATQANKIHAKPTTISDSTEPQSSSPANPVEHGNDTSTPRSMTSGSSPAPSQQHAARRRSTMDQPRGSNRLSGFFSNLMHRQSATPSTARPINRSEAASTSALSQKETSKPASRAPSPTNTRPISPPPSLPPPTLQELGLSLSVITTATTVSQVSYPPSGGAFMAPHFLLLCHAQGLDFIPLMGLPSAQPFSLVRRIPFKSVVVLEQRGVLVAIAGRSQSVRVYVLDEIRKAIDWRMEFESRKEKEKERDRLRREGAKRPPAIKIPMVDMDVDESALPSKTPTFASTTRDRGVKSARRMSVGVPRTPTPNRPKPSVTTVDDSKLPTTPEPSGKPPPYSSSPVETRPPPPRLQSQISTISLRPRVPSAIGVHTVGGSEAPVNRDAKTDAWVDNRDPSDDEAIDVLAAQTSGSQALDEGRNVRAMARRHSNARNTYIPGESPPVSIPPPIPSSLPARRRALSALDIEMLSNPTATTSPEPPSPAPTLMSLRQALHSPRSEVPPLPSIPPVEDPDTNDEEDEIPSHDRVSLAQILSESRIPSLPPAGTRRSQEPLLLSEVIESPQMTEFGQPPSLSARSEGRRGRRRWSILDAMFPGDALAPEVTQIGTIELSGSRSATLPSASGSRPVVRRSPSTRSIGADGRGPPLERQQSAQWDSRGQRPRSIVPPLPTPTGSVSSRTSRFIPRAFTAALTGRRFENNRPPTFHIQTSQSDQNKRGMASVSAAQTPPPKLDFVKLSGTKGSIMLKAVETARKSFLAILCGANGEKVELYAGTYRTNLGLSRTFILPDSPRTLELQLQGDDLVEVFLMFSHNVFGLEPATVRVREVRIGRSERRAARERRRARENALISENVEQDPIVADDDDPPTNVNLHVNMAPAVISTTEARPVSPHMNPPSGTQTPEPAATAGSQTESDELIAAATAAMGPYTTFQQLGFAPNFPLASMADECVIPPTYPDFLQYRSMYEPDSNGTSNVDLALVQFSPPGLPIPVISPPPKWLYKDPKGRIHGPWKAKLMQSWYKDGLLPPDLPVRREEDSDFIPLKDLRQQSVDPSEPFQTSSAMTKGNPQLVTYSHNSNIPLLSPISLLAQPAHYGPPALFFSSRGGHSTTIVDARGRSVLKGRFMWSVDDPDTENHNSRKMGDVKRIEAFDIQDRSVLVAMRQGGVEAVDMGDALLRPADESRAVLPHFTPPVSNVNRRSPFVWRIGTPITTSFTTSAVLTNKNKASLTSAKKPPASLSKSSSKPDTATIDSDMESAEEIVFLGRNASEVFLCERQTTSFRILRLSPTSG